MVIESLTMFIRERNTQDMSDAQTLVALPSFLKEFAKNHNEAVASRVSSEQRGIFSWPEAVQYPLRNSAQSSKISSPIGGLPAVSQEPMGTEKELDTKLNKAVCRCGNV